MNYNRPIGYQGKALTEEDRAYEKGGYRERYAMRRGKRYIRKNGNHIWWVFKYSTTEAFQDANGATYDVTEWRWIG